MYFYSWNGHLASRLYSNNKYHCMAGESIVFDDVRQRWSHDWLTSDVTCPMWSTWPLLWCHVFTLTFYTIGIIRYILPLFYRDMNMTYEGRRKRSTNWYRDIGDKNAFWPCTYIVYRKWNIIFSRNATDVREDTGHQCGSHRTVTGDASGGEVSSVEKTYDVIANIVTSSKHLWRHWNTSDVTKTPNGLFNHFVAFCGIFLFFSSSLGPFLISTYYARK